MNAKQRRKAAEHAVPWIQVHPNRRGLYRLAVIAQRWTRTHLYWEGGHVTASPVLLPEREADFIGVIGPLRFSEVLDFFAHELGPEFSPPSPESPAQGTGSPECQVPGT